MSSLKSLKVSIGLVTWNGEKFLPDCLDSLFAQTFSDWELILVDNGSKDHTVRYLQRRCPHCKLIQNQKNVGFAAGHNQAIAQSRGEYYLVLNQDTILEPDYLANLVAFSDKHPAVGSVAGKIKRLTDGQKTNKIDSLGLKMWRSGQVTDLGETQEDRDINSAPHEVFGVSGVIPLYRRAALEATAHLNRPGKNEYLDETFFAYKEDIDLAFRLRLQGWTSYCVPAAVAFHSRSVRDEGAVERGNLAIARRRQNMSRFRRKLSFANHHFLYFKNLPCQVWWRNLPPMLWYETKMWGYALLREPFLIPDMGRVFSRFPEMMRKRYAIMNQRKISSFDLQRWFS